MSNKTIDEKRFSSLITSMFRQTKVFVPRKFRKKVFSPFSFPGFPISRPILAPCLKKHKQRMLITPPAVPANL